MVTNGWWLTSKYFWVERYIDSSFVISPKKGNRCNTKVIRIEDDKVNLSWLQIRSRDCPNLRTEFILLDDFDVKARYKKIGGEVEEDTVCDSKLMLSILDHVGTALSAA